MDNAEQNKLLLAALDKVLEGREAAAEAMREVLKSGMNIRFVKPGKKREERVAMLITIMPDENTMLVKDGRQYVDVEFHRFIEVVEPMAAPDEDEEEPVEDDDNEQPPF